MTETNTPPWQQEHPDYDGWVSEYGGKNWGEAGEILHPRLMKADTPPKKKVRSGRTTTPPRPTTRATSRPCTPGPPRSISAAS